MIECFNFSVYFAKYSSASFSSPALPFVPSVIAFFTSSILHWNQEASGQPCRYIRNPVLAGFFLLQYTGSYRFLYNRSSSEAISHDVSQSQYLLQVLPAQLLNRHVQVLLFQEEHLQNIWSPQRPHLYICSQKHIQHWSSCCSGWFSVITAACGFPVHPYGIYIAVMTGIPVFLFHFFHKSKGLFFGFHRTDRCDKTGFFSTSSPSPPSYMVL